MDLDKFYTKTFELQNAPAVKLLSAPEHSGAKYKHAALSVEAAANRSVTVNYSGYTTPIKISSVGKVSSTSKTLRSSVSIDSYSITQGFDDQAFQTRSIVYSSSATPVTFDAPYSSLLEEGKLTLLKLPPVEGQVAVRDSAVEQVGVRLPASQRGSLPIPFVLDIPVASSPDTFAYGLLAASQGDDKRLVVSLLNEFLYQAKQRFWILKDDNDKWFVNPSPVWGFESQLFTDVYEEGPKELWTNCLLGFAVCVGIKSLQDVYPLNSFKLYGAVEDYQEALVAALGGLVELVKASYLDKGWLRYSFSETESSSEATVVGSAWADLFLAHYLSLNYDLSAHYTLTKLRSSLVRASAGILSDQSSFRERDFEEFPSLKEPAFLNIQQQEGYEEAFSTAALCLWSSQFYPSFTEKLLRSYESVRESLVIPDSELGPSFLVSLVYRNYPVAGVAIPAWVSELRTQAESDSVPFDYKVLATAGAFVSNYFDAQIPAAELLQASVLSEERRLWPFGYRWTSEEKERDRTTVIGSLLYADSELYRRPQLAYLTLKGAHSPATSAGEQLRIWASLVARSLNLSSDAFISTWLRGFLLDRQDLQTLLEEVFGYEVLDLQEPAPPPFATLRTLRDGDNYFSYTSDVPSENFSQPPVYEPGVYDLDVHEPEFINREVLEEGVFVEGVFVTPQPGLVEFDRDDITAEQYFSIAYKPSSGRLVNYEFGLCSSDERINKNLGFVRRAVPGFPHRDPRCDSIDILSSSVQVLASSGLWLSDSQRVSASSYVRGQKNVWVTDGPVVIEPLANYVPIRSYFVNHRPVSFLSEAIKRTQVAGITLEVIGTYTSEYS